MDPTSELVALKRVFEFLAELCREAREGRDGVEVEVSILFLVQVSISGRGDGWLSRADGG